jgi:hypothetical protein
VQGRGLPWSWKHVRSTASFTSSEDTAPFVVRVRGGGAGRAAPDSQPRRMKDANKTVTQPSHNKRFVILNYSSKNVSKNKASRIDNAQVRQPAGRPSRSRTASFTSAKPPDYNLHQAGQPRSVRKLDYNANCCRLITWTRSAEWISKYFRSSKSPEFDHESDQTDFGLHCRLDEPAATGGDRIPSGRNQSPEGAAGRQTITIHRRPASPPRKEGQTYLIRKVKRDRKSGDSADSSCLAPEAHRQEV